MTDEATAAINLANVAGCDHSMYLMVWDIDDFKQVNDTYGHYFGDEVIKHLATELNRAVANRGLVGRIGGDEFLVLLKEANGEDTLRSLLKAVRKKLKVDLAQEKPDYLGDFTRILKETFDRKGNVVIPSFAVGRTQEMLYFIREIKEKGLLSEYPDFEVYLDSPLAIEATKVFTKNMRECFDEEALALVNAGINPLVFPGLHTAISSEDSKMINFIEKPKVIISASGMCDAGRIRHHLKHNLWREECTILFVGYQANGTLGRRLLEGEKNVKLFGESIEVHARIESLHGVSGHADMNGLLKWVKAFDPPIQRVFVVHGEDTVTEEFAKTVEETFDYQAFAPFPCAEVDLLKNEILSEGVKIPVKAKKPAQKKADAAYDRLTLAGKRLMDIIYSNAGLSNKDKAKFEAQINNLADKWEL